MDLNIAEAVLAQAVDALVEEGMVDFGRLSAEMQASILKRAVTDSVFLESLNLSSILHAAYSKDVSFVKNKVLAEYSLENYATQLKHLYTQVTDSEAVDFLDEKKVLSQFCSPAIFFFTHLNYVSYEAPYY